MTTYPSSVRVLDALTFTEGHENPAIAEAKMEGGYVLSRPRFTRRPRRTFTFAYVDMTDTDKSTLATFWDTIRGSSAAFDWTHPATAEVINCRFSADTKMKFSREGYGPTNRWRTETLSLVEV